MTTLSPVSTQPNYSGPDRRNQPERQKVKFDATINLGHILTFVGFILAGATAWTTLDKRVVVLEEARTAQKVYDVSQDARMLESNAQMKEVLARLDRQVERLADKIDNVKSTKP